MPHTDIDKRLMNLEVKASFTEDLVEQLNQTIFQQQQQIDALIREGKAQWLGAAYRVKAKESGCYSRRWEPCVFQNGICQKH